MHCPQCGTTMKYRKEQNYRYRESGLNNVIVVVPVHSCPKCGEVLPEIRDIKGLHAAIADHLFGKRTPLTGAEIRFLRKQMGMKAKELAAILGVDAVTVSRWETGTKRVGDVTDRLVRCLYLFHRIWAGREVLPARSFERIREDLSQIRPVKTPRAQKITIQAEAV